MYVCMCVCVYFVEELYVIYCMFLPSIFLELFPVLSSKRKCVTDPFRFVFVVSRNSSYAFHVNANERQQMMVSMLQ